METGSVFSGSVLHLEPLDIDSDPEDVIHKAKLSTSVASVLTVNEEPLRRLQPLPPSKATDLGTYPGGTETK